MSSVIVSELGSARRTDGEIHGWLHHVVVGADWAVVGHGALPVAAILEIGQVRGKFVPRRIRHEERHNPIICRNRAQSIGHWAEPQAASAQIGAFENTGQKNTAHEGIGGVLVSKFVCTLWKLGSMPPMMIAPFIGSVEPEGVDRNHVEILPLERSVCAQSTRAEDHP
jgi:hypothetical protein